MQTRSSSTRWELTQQTFHALLRSLHAKEELAVERYQRLHGRLTLFFMRHRSQAPEDLADQVINRLARKLTEGQSIENIEAFALGIARLVVREEQAKAIREQQCHQELSRNGSNIRHTPNEKETLQPYVENLMEDQWTELPATARTMLARYHDGRGLARIRERQRLATEMGLSIGALRKRIFDLQATLRAKLQQAVRSSHETSKDEENRYL